MNRQNSSPLIGRSAEQRRPATVRSKTPPPSFETPRNVSKLKNRAPLCTAPRPFPKKTSSEGSSISQPANAGSSGFSKPKSKPVSEELSNEEMLDIKYNLYCQTVLMTLHSKAVRERNEAKIIQELEKLQMSQLEMDEKISTLDANIEKIRFLKKTRKNLQEKIETYEKIIASVDESKLDEQIRMLEENLTHVQLKNFSLPKNEEDTKEVLKSIEDINKELSRMPELQKKIAPLTQLHSSWLEVKENVQKEEQLKINCEKELKIAEELVYDYCFKKSLELEKIKKK